MTHADVRQSFIHTDFCEVTQCVCVHMRACALVLVSCAEGMQCDKQETMTEQTGTATPTCLVAVDGQVDVIP